MPRIPADRVGLTCGQGTRRVRANVTPGAPRTGLTLTPLSGALSHRSECVRAPITSPGMLRTRAPTTAPPPGPGQRNDSPQAAPPIAPPAAPTPSPTRRPVEHVRMPAATRFEPPDGP